MMALFLLTPIASCKAEEASILPTHPLIVKSKAGGMEHRFEVEIANTPETIMQGLMFRSSMPENHGMLFAFPHDGERNFWMKNTYIPLDILFIKRSGIIHHIHEGARPLDETPLPSNGPVLNVLELNAGVTNMLGIKPGDIVYLPQK